MSAESRSAVIARAADGGYVSVRVEAVHAHACPYWRLGRRHGPCTCGARSVWADSSDHVAAVMFAADTSAGAFTDAVAANRREFRIEVLRELLTLTDAGIALDSAALRELVSEVEAATMPL